MVGSSSSHHNAPEPSAQPWRAHFTETPRPSTIRQPHQLDPQDLIHQCLFQLFTHEPHEYIQQGSVTQQTWAGTTYHEATGRLVFDATLLSHIYHHQRQTLLSTYYHDEAKLFQDLSAIFRDHPPGRLKHIHGAPHLVTPAIALAVTIKPVDLILAERIHRSFHFIHDPKPGIHALGLYLPDQTLPFSVLVIAPVQSDYRQAALHKYGLDPAHTYEFTRLYSAPNTPKNTSSVILTAAHRYLRHLDPRHQATLTSFLPSYSSGASLLGGSFDVMLYAKSLNQPGHTSLLPLLELIRMQDSPTQVISKSPALVFRIQVEKLDYKDI